MVRADLAWRPRSGVGAPIALHEIAPDGAYGSLWQHRLPRLRRMAARVKDGKDEPSSGPQNAHDAMQSRSQVGDVHQGHMTDDAIERAVRHAVEAPGGGVAIL